jgi:hypothetical protein
VFWPDFPLASAITTIQDHFCAMRPNSSRLIATRRNTTRSNWVQLGIGAGVLLLPPLALGAAFYAMLGPPDGGTADTAAVQTQAAVPDEPRHTAPAMIAAAPAVTEPPGKSAADNAQDDRGPARAGPLQVAVTPAAPGGAAATPAAAGAAVTPAADPPPAAPKRPAHHHAASRPQQQDPFPLRSWLQDIGLLARDGNNTPQDAHRQ